MVSLNALISYISHEYSKEYGEEISEMKLHKLLYLTQRESLIQRGEPLIRETFYGWKYGPILKEVRSTYPSCVRTPYTETDLISEIRPIMESVFSQYAPKDAWSLSRLTHGEYSWQQSRKGIPDSANSDNPISIEDIKIDAQRIKERRELLHQMGFGR